MSSVTSCDPINPYTESKTFGVPYNGGYKPDPTLEWIPADNNVIDDKDDLVRPLILEPANTYLKTCEARRDDPRVGGIPGYKIEYDDFTDTQPIAQVEPPPSAAEVSKKNDPTDMQWKILIVLALIIFVLLVSSRYK